MRHGCGFALEGTAFAAHDSPGYQEALKVLGKNAVEREIRIVEGLA